MSPAISPVAPSPTLPLSSRRPSVSFGGFGLTSPRRFGGRGPDSHVRRQLNGPKDCHTLYPGTGAGVPLRWAGSLDHNGVGCRLQLLGTMGVGCCDHNALWPPSPSTRRLRLLPTFRRPVGLLPIGPPPPKRASPHGSVCCLPFPSRRCPTLHAPAPGLPTFGSGRQSHPPLQGTMDGAVVPKFVRQSDPLAPDMQAKDDAIEYPARISALAAPAFGWVFLQDDRLDACQHARPLTGYIGAWFRRPNPE